MTLSHDHLLLQFYRWVKWRQLKVVWSNDGIEEYEAARYPGGKVEFWAVCRLAVLWSIPILFAWVCRYVLSWAVGILVVVAVLVALGAFALSLPPFSIPLSFSVAHLLWSLLSGVLLVVAIVLVVVTSVFLVKGALELRKRIPKYGRYSIVINVGGDPANC